MKTFKLKELVFGNSGNITKETIIQNFKNSGFIYTINEDDGEELLTYHIHKEQGVVFEIVFIKEYIINNSNLKISDVDPWGEEDWD